jgi:DNA polymerase-1
MSKFREFEEINKVLIIDLFNLFFRCFCVTPTRNPEGFHTGGLYGTLNSIKYLINITNPDAVVVAFDGPGGSKRRRRIDPNYKATRKVPQKICSVFDYETPEQEKESLFNQLGKFKIYLDMLPVFQLLIDNIEADDTISYVTTKICKNKEVIIVSTDKDFYQLTEGDRIKIFRPTTKEFIDETAVKDQYDGINPKNFTIYRCFDGDVSDNIPGVKGFGPKTTLKLFGELLRKDTSYSIDDILEYCEKYRKENNRYKDVLDSRERLETNYKLMQLYNTNISLSSMTRIDDILNSEIPRMNSFSLRVAFDRDNLWGQIRNIDKWLLSFAHLNNVGFKYNKYIKEKGVLT